MSRIRHAMEYLLYWITSGTNHSVHSPFIFDFVTHVIYGKGRSGRFSEIESIRSRMRADERVLHVLDFGADPSRKSNYHRKVSSIARHSLKPPKYAELLHRIALFQKSEVIIELGASLGITTMYFAAASPQAKIFTLEGCPETAKVAGENFSEARFNNIHIRSGNFDDTLPALLRQINTPDLVFVDGNHQKDAAIRYFDLLASCSSEKTIIVMDDINWSEGMKEAWKVIKNREKVMTTIDLFMLGIIFFDSRLSKQHFRIRF